jgi:hypothetical protein
MGPSVDPGRPIEFLGGSMPEMLAAGLAIDAGVLTELQRTGSTQRLDSIAVPTGGDLGQAGQFGHLAAHLNDEVQRIATDTMGSKPRRPGARAAATREPDALDEIIADLAAKRREAR